MKPLGFLALSSVLFAAAADPAAGEGAAAAPSAGTPKPKKEKPVKEPKPERIKQNGVTRPSAGTQTGKVWEIADKISSTHNRPANRAEVTEAGKAAGINESTITTQFGQWRRFYGIKKENTPAAPKEKKGKAKGGEVANPTDTDKANADAEQVIAESNAAEAGAGVE